MHRFGVSVLGVLLLLLPVHAQEPRGRLIEDVWHAALLKGSRAGYVRTTVREIERDGKKRFHATSELKLTISRNSRPLVLRMESGDDETPEGKVIGVFMRQYQGQQLQLALQGTVEEGELVVQVNGNVQMKKRIPWNDDVIGLYRQERLFQERQAKPGDQFMFLSFEPMLNAVLTNQVAVKQQEEVKLLEGKKE